MQYISDNVVKYQQKINFDKNFLPRAAEIYDWSVAANVNPEFVVIRARHEKQFDITRGASNNYWGLGAYNSTNTAFEYATFQEGVEAFAQYITKYEDPGQWFYGSIIEQTEARIAAGVDPLGYGYPGTLSGCMIMYSYPGDHGTGDADYFYPEIYGSEEEYYIQCKNSGLPEHAAGTEATVWEAGTFTALQVKDMIKSWNQFFGNYGSLYGDGTGNQQVVELAKQQVGKPYVYGTTGSETFDCSGLVYWIYHTNLGITLPRSTDGYKSYAGGVHEITWEEAQPGDILIVFDYERNASDGHAGIYTGNDSYIDAKGRKWGVVDNATGAREKFEHVFRFN